MRSTAAMPAFGLCLWMLATPAAAIDYYVARDDPGASDGHDGRAETYQGGTTGPWKTLVRAVNTATAGDTVRIRAGDYRGEDMGWGVGRIALRTSGTQTQPLRYVAARGEQPVVFAFRLVGSSWIEIEGLTFINPGLSLPDTWVDMPETVIDDPTVIINPDEPWSSREAKVRKKYATFMSIMDYFDTDYPSGIDVDGASDILIRGNSFSLYSFGIQLRNSATRVTVEDNSFAYCRNGIFTWRPSPSTVDSILRRNILTQSFDTGIDVREGATRVRIESNQSDYSGLGHIALHSGARDTSVHGNSVRHGGFYTETMEFPGSTAITVHTAGPGNIVERNLAAFQNDATGLDGNGYSADLLLGVPVTIRNNVAYRNMGSGIALIHSPNGVVVNNTLVENGFRSTATHNGVGLRLAHDDDVGNVIANNIFSGNRAGGLHAVHLLQRQRLVDHNLYNQPGTALLWDGWDTGDRYYTSIHQVWAGPGQWERNGVVGDPAFLRSDGTTFHISPVSPAVDAGLSDSYAPTFDLDGVPRTGAPDLGALEAVTIPPPSRFGTGRSGPTDGRFRSIAQAVMVEHEALAEDPVERAVSTSGGLQAWMTSNPRVHHTTTVSRNMTAASIRTRTGSQALLLPGEAPDTAAPANRQPPHGRAEPAATRALAS